MKRRKKGNFPAKYVLLFMSIFCVLLLFFSVRISFFDTSANTAVGYVIVPMQKGINRIGNGLNNLRDNLISKKQLREENEELRERLSEAQAALYQYPIDQEEYSQLKELYETDQAYSEYDKVAAEVIGKDSGNWFSTFLINRGARSGIEEGMNVIADGALVGIVIDVGPNYATVRSIIDDLSNISSKNLSTGELIIVNGSLQSMNANGMILFSELRDVDDAAKVGDEIVTSRISDLYLPNIPIGYITEITEDANLMTKSGQIAPIVDFSNLEQVFVVLQTKSDLTGQDTDTEGEEEE